MIKTNIPFPGPWAERGACRQADHVDWFYDIEPGYNRLELHRWAGVEGRRRLAVDRREYRENLAAAREVCRGCPVRKQCEEYSRTYELAGIWAGTTEQERRAYDRRRRRRGLLATGA